MKKLFLTGFIIALSFAVNAQFTKATLQATGLTCAMCSNAINKALQQLPFVESVRPDIKNSAFNIVFKSGVEIEIDDLKKAVEDAGFSIGSLKITGNFSEMKLEKDQHVKIGDENFHFLDAEGKVLDGEQTITIVDKDYVTAKQFKKMSSHSKMNCLQSGKTESCCMKEGMTEGARVYHVTM